jgi:hypothetical protein
MKKRKNPFLYVLCVLFCSTILLFPVLFSVNFGLIASADYDFEFIDEDEADDIIYGDLSEDDVLDHYSINDNEVISSQSSGERSESSFNPVRSFIISLIIGLIVAFVAVSIMKSSMKSVHKKSGASDYRKENGVKLTVNFDRYLGEKTERSAAMRVNNVSVGNQNTRLK